jgi:hypothetical protein
MVKIKEVLNSNETIMETTKKWYLSKTIVAQMIAVICFGLSVTGVINVDEATQQELINIVLTI